jgi:rhamnose transport system permease protein
MGAIRTNTRALALGARIFTSHQAVLAALLIALLLAARVSRPAFVSAETQISLASQSIELAILAVPMTLILIAGGIDLSIGSIMALAAVVLGLAYEAGASIWLAAALALLSGAVAGALNGTIIAFAGIHPLIVTLATLSLYRGVAEAVSSARAISGFPESFIALSNTTFAAVPLPALLFLVILTAGWITLRGTAVGRYLCAVGYNETASRFTGLPVNRIKLWLYMFNGAAAGMAAVLFVARRNTAKADIAAGMELDVITAVVLGGTSVFGGRGGLGGTLLGVLLLHEVRQFISWRWNNDELILVVVGGLLIGSVLLNQLLNRSRPDRALA